MRITGGRARKLTHVKPGVRSAPSGLLETAQSLQGSEIAPLADQPQMPTIEFARTVRFQRPGAFAAPIALPAPQPRPASDPTRHCFDEVAKPRRTQTARQPAMIPPLNHAKVPADHALGPVAVALAGC